MLWLNAVVSIVSRNLLLNDPSTLLPCCSPLSLFLTLSHSLALHFHATIVAPPPAAGSAGSTTPLSHEAMVALRPTAELAKLPVAATAALTLWQQRQQQQRLCQQPQQQQPQQQQPQQQQQQQPQQQQQQQRKVRHKEEQQQQQGCSSLPWLGAQLDVGGYTKRGFISAGGKDQNQDRCGSVGRFFGGGGHVSTEGVLGYMHAH